MAASFTRLASSEVNRSPLTLAEWDIRRTRMYRAWSFFVFLAVLASFPVNRCRAFSGNRLWERIWFNYLGVRVVGPASFAEYAKSRQLLYAIIPHGLFPFGLAFAAIEPIRSLLRINRLVVATVTRFVPVLRHVIGWLGAVDASPQAVNAALQSGETLAVAPGGINEMFWGVPRAGCLPDEEYALLLERKGFVRLALQVFLNTFV